MEYVSGWISTRTSSHEMLVQRVGHKFPVRMGGVDPRLNPEGIKAALACLIEQIQSHDNFALLMQGRSSTLAGRFQLLLWGSNEVEGQCPRELERSVLASLSPGNCPAEGLALISMLLVLQREAVLELHKGFARLHEEMVCLEDTDADMLFNVHGETQKALVQAKELAGRSEAISSALLLPNISWRSRRPDLVRLAAELSRGHSALQEFCARAASLAAKRRVFVARLKTAVEARAATEAVSATTLLAQALQPHTRLDFPLVTEICERATSDAAELDQVVLTLEAALGSPTLQTRLKVLTITNELLYDDVARQAFASKPAFQILQPFALEEGNVAMELAAANAGLLASEIARRLSRVDVAQGSCCYAMPPPALACWLSSVARTPSRQSAELEPVSWSRARSAVHALNASMHGGTATCADAIAVLDQLYRCLEHVARSIENLKSAMPPSQGEDVGELTESFLQSASHVQSSALEWKCRVVDAFDSTDGREWSAHWPRRAQKPLDKFLSRAVIVGDSLNACLAVLLARRPG